MSDTHEVYRRGDNDLHDLRHAMLQAIRISTIAIVEALATMQLRSGPEGLDPDGEKMILDVLKKYQLKQ